MEKKRIGKDLKIIWKITTNGENIDLSGRRLRLEIRHSKEDPSILPFTSDGNIIYAYFRGTEQKHIGNYSLTLWENIGRNGQTAVDSINAFQLVPNTMLEGGASDCHNLEIESVDLGSSDIQIGGMDGITPKLKIEEDYWYVSYDYGKTWERLGRSVGRDGTVLYPKFSVNSEMELEMESEMATDRVEYSQESGELILNI